MKGFPRRYIVYDCETTSTPCPGEHGRQILEFRLAVAVFTDLDSRSRGRHNWYDFDTQEEWHEILCGLDRSDEPIYIFAHNHAFDARVIGFFRELALGRYSLLPPDGVKPTRTTREPLFAIDGRPFLMRLFRPDGQILLLYDLGNWLDTSLAKIGEMLETPKWPLPEGDASGEDWLDYCRNDVEITLTALELVWDWCRERGIKDWQPTIAAQALQSYRLRYSKRKIRVPQDPHAMALCRAAYYGGRQDAFRLGRIEGPVIQVDVNSMYPSLMKDGLYPCEIVETMHEATKPTAGAPENPGLTTAEVWLDSAEAAYPLRAKDGTFFVRGRVRTVLCGPELRRACERGHVVQYGRFTRYRMSRLFAAFVTDLWATRMACRAAGDRIGDKLAKVFMDSLYGKFGQRSGEWITLGQDYPPDHYGAGIVVRGTDEEAIDWRVIAGIYQRRLRDELAPHAFAAIPAFVTSYGRVFMDSVRGKLWEDGVYYQATDSLLVDAANVDILKAAGLWGEGELGKFRFEEDWPWVEIKNVGWIERPGTSIRPGADGSGDLLPGGIAESTRWEGPWTGILQHRVSCASIKETLIRLHGTYRKQSVSESGRCRPWVISNWHVTPERQRREPLLRYRD